MEGQRRDIFLWTDMVLTVLSAAWIYYLLAQCQQYLSFAGFGALVAMLLLLLPGFACLLLEIFLLYAGSRGRRWCSAAAYIIQIAAALPSIWLLSIDAAIFGALWVYPALMALGGIGVIRELIRRQ